MNNNTHTLTLNDRSTINISGVIKVENFDKEEFLLETVMGFIAEPIAFLKLLHT